MIEADVKGEEVVDVVEIAALGHRLPAAGDLLGGLEEHRQRSVELALFDPLERPQRHREVGVVAAGVHVAVVFGPESLGGRPVLALVGFPHRNRVEIDAQPDAGTSPARGSR